MIRKRFDRVSVGAQDASRAKRAFLIEIASAVRDAGAWRLRIADTVGAWDPFETRETLRILRARTPGLSFGFHAHDDLGMAVANTLAAVRAGVTSVDVTVNGLGERAGNAALEEVAVALQLRGFHTGLDTTKLWGLSSLVSQASGRPVHGSKPVVGEDVYCHQSGIHVRAWLADRRAYECFPPSAVGAPDTRVVLGKHSGRAAVRHELAACGIVLAEHQEAELAERVRAYGASRRCLVSSGLLLEVLASMGGP
jgi:homocitrate synthase NifV